jgi:hypothetical protein
VDGNNPTPITSPISLLSCVGMAETKSDDASLPVFSSVASTFHTLLAGVPVSKHCSPVKTLHIEASKTTDDALRLLAEANVTEAHIFDDTTSVRDDSGDVR